jgi:hypothetical protein
MTWRSHLAFFALLVWLSLCPGCASYRPLPASFVTTNRTARVVVRQMPSRPQMMDSGNGGIIGAVITATSRTDKMRDQLAGIRGEDVQDPLLAEFSRCLSEHLQLGNTNEDLRIEVTIQTWGWFVPTIDFGIKVGEYESQVIGRVDVYNNTKKKIGYAIVQVSRPIGLKPQEDRARAAVAELAREFAQQAEQALIHSVKPRQVPRYL